MSFSSILFIFAFLPVFFLLYFLLNRNWYRNAILLVGSLVFFAWVDPTKVHILVISVLINYLVGLTLEKFHKREKRNWTRAALWVGVVANLGMLIFYKYLGFFETTIGSLFNSNLEIVRVALPLGISYFTFSGISYLLDVHQQVEHAETNLLKFSNYLIMFPKLLQGPITRFGQVKNQLATMTVNSDDLAVGIRRFIIGLAKKVLIADTLAVVTEKVFSATIGDYGARVAWVGIIAYTLQIYFDFSGYTDMAIGVGRIFGFKLPENFNYPYISRSISDFWRRWHMTLTAWFRTYVFIPLEYARKKEKFLRTQSNLVIVFLLTGLWHGAGWNFIIWGIYFGILLALETGVWGKALKKLPAFLQHFYSILMIIIGWIIFRFSAIADWQPFVKTLLGGFGWSGRETLRTMGILMYLPVVLAGIVLSTPVLKKLELWLRGKGVVVGFILDILYLAAFLLATAFVLSKGYNAFIYEQF